MKLRVFIRSFVEDFKARRRGEKRIAPRGLRGRVYASNAPADAGGTVVRIGKTPTAQLTMTIRRADGTVEKVTVPAKVTRSG
jgi:hypothetical protein